MQKLTALTIAGNYPENILIDTATNAGKSSGWMYLLRDGAIHRTLLNTEETFDSEQEAKDYMIKLAEWCVNNKETL